MAVQTQMVSVPRTAGVVVFALSLVLALIALPPAAAQEQQPGAPGLPEVSVDPESVEATVPQGRATEETLTISNQGEEVLEWEFGEIPDEATFESGPFITHPGEGPDGTDLSTLQSDSLEMDALGFNVHGDLGHRLADEFTIAGENDWALDTVTWYGYDTGSTTESTFTEVNYQICEGPPDDADR